MALTLHQLAPAVGARAKKTRVGRGYGSGRGTTAGRGTKGQRARTGGRKRLKLKGLKQMLLAFPKSRGFRSLAPAVYAVPLTRLSALAEKGGKIDLTILKQKGIVPRSATKVKLIGNAPFSAAMTFADLQASTSAAKAITDAGGQLISSKKQKKKKS
jgi:large subunit ribosomal protein L15